MFVQVTANLAIAMVVATIKTFRIFQPIGNILRKRSKKIVQCMMNMLQIQHRGSSVTCSFFKLSRSKNNF